MMAFKARLMGDSDALNRVSVAATPADAKAISRQISPWDAALWRRARFDAICLGTRLKFTPRKSAWAHACFKRVTAALRKRPRATPFGASASPSQTPRRGWLGE